MRRPIAIDAFAGAGGLSLGLDRSGWRVALAFDHDPMAVATYGRNLGRHVAELDAERLTTEQLLSRAGVSAGDVELLAGGPPCQGFSLQRRGARSDPRNQLSLLFLEWVRDIRPAAFLIENVPAITSVRGREVLSAVRELTGDFGYGLAIHAVNALDYGMAQRRRRAFIVGMSNGQKFEWPTTVASALTVRDVIGDLPAPPSDGTAHPQFPNHYREVRLSAKNIERIRAVPEGGSRVDLPPHLQLACHQSGHRHLDTYGRLAWDGPSGTITARFDSFTRGRFGHPVDDRSITLREGARLQGFPDDFVFLGNREQCARQIGNAVPPPLAAVFGEALIAQLRASRFTAA